MNHLHATGRDWLKSAALLLAAGMGLLPRGTAAAAAGEALALGSRPELFVDDYHFEELRGS